MQQPQISIIIPLYNEQQVYPMLIKRLNALMDASPLIFEVILVNDGSIDQTPILMRQTGMVDKRYHCIFLSRNFGHQTALTAGLNYATATEAAMIIDGDLQDPPELLPKLYEQYQNGFDVVYAVRKNRKEGILKKTSYFIFYRLIKRISKIDLPLDSGDFALISRRVIDILNSMPEESRYLRGMRTWIGFKQTGVEYERLERAAGAPKYNLKMLLGLAYNGIFNFSEVPIKAITNLGLMTILLPLAFFFYTIYMKFTSDTVPTGFTTLLFTVILFGGVQLISIGVIGEYVLRTFFQVKQRPLFIVNERIINKTSINKDISVNLNPSTPTYTEEQTAGVRNQIGL